MGFLLHLQITSMGSAVLCLAGRWMCARFRLRVWLAVLEAWFKFVHYSHLVSCYSDNNSSDANPPTHILIYWTSDGQKIQEEKKVLNYFKSIQSQRECRQKQTDILSENNEIIDLVRTIEFLLNTPWKIFSHEYQQNIVQQLLPTSLKYKSSASYKIGMYSVIFKYQVIEYGNVISPYLLPFPLNCWISDRLAMSLDLLDDTLVIYHRRVIVPKECIFSSFFGIITNLC